MKSFLCTLTLVANLVVPTNNSINVVNDSTLNIKGLGYSINAVKSPYISTKYILFGAPVINETWLSNKIYEISKDSVPIKESSTTYKTGTTFSEITKKINSNFNLNVDTTMNVQPFSLGSSIGFNISGSNNYKYYASQYYYCLDAFFARESYYLPYYSSNLTEYINNLDLTYLNALDSVFSGIVSFSSLFDVFGTHVIGHAVYGGKANLFYSVMSNQIDVGGEFSTKLNATFEKGISAAASFDINSITEESSGSYEEYFNLVVAGGSIFSALSFEDFYDRYYDWCDTIDDEKVLIGVSNDGLIPLWKLLPAQYNTTENVNAFKEAYKNYATANLINEDFYSADPLVGVTTYSSGVIRSGEYEITDDYEISPEFDTIDLNTFGEYSMQVLKTNGYQTMDITLTLDMVEVNDGYQEFFILNGKTKETATQIFHEEKYTFYDGSKHTTYETREITFNNISLSSLNASKLFIAYGANGSGSDNWKNKNLKVSITYRK